MPLLRQILANSQKWEFAQLWTCHIWRDSDLREKMDDAPKAVPLVAMRCRSNAAPQDAAG